MKLIKLNGIYNIAKISKKKSFQKNKIIDAIFTIVIEEKYLSFIYEKKHNNIFLSIDEKIEIEEGWELFKIDANIDFNCYGILKSIISNISDSGISILVTSSFDTDYFFIKSDMVDKAIKIWKKNNFVIKGLS